MSAFENITLSEPSPNVTRPSMIPVGVFELAIFCFNILVGFPTNFYTICHIITRSGNGVASNAFVLCLSICSLMHSVNCMIAFTTNWFTHPGFLAAIQFLKGFAITGSPLFQNLISAEHYLAVVHPVTFLKYKPLRYRLVCCAVAWTITLCSCVFCFLCYLIYSHFVYLWFFSVQFAIYFFMKFFLCLGVLRALKQSGPGDHRRHKENENHAKRRAFYLILLITVSTAIIYIPFSVSGIISAVTKQPYQIVWSICSIFFALSTLIAPYNYLHRIGKLTCLKD